MTAEYREVSVFDRKTEEGEDSYIGVRYIKNPDGSFSPVVHPDVVGEGDGSSDALTDAQLAARLGTVGDAKVISDAPGTLLALIRGLVTMMADPTASLVALDSGSAWFGKSISPSFSVSDVLTRPHNTTPYGLNKAINCNCSVTAMSYSGLTVTLTVPNAFSVGDHITVAGVNTGFTVTNINGNWVCKEGTNATTVVFNVTVQPTGTTPQTLTAGTISKLLSVPVADAVGHGVSLSRLSISAQGIAMVGMIRVYVYTAPTAVLVDQSTFTLLSANDQYRRDYFDIPMITEGAGSDVSFGSIRLAEMFKCEPTDTRLYFRLVAESVMTPVNDGVITLRVSGRELGG